MSEKLIVDWNNYNKTVESLAIQIHESGYKPTLLVGIMRGVNFTVVDVSIVNATVSIGVAWTAIGHRCCSQVNASCRIVTLNRGRASHGRGGITEDVNLVIGNRNNNSCVSPRAA